MFRKWTLLFHLRLHTWKFTKSASTRGDPNIRCISAETQTSIYLSVFLSTYHLTWESQIKSKTVISWSSRKKKVPFILSELKFFNICILSQCIVYWIHFQNTHTFTYQKALLRILLCFFLKSLKAFSVSLRLSLRFNFNIFLNFIFLTQ